jgi:cytochrome b561
VLAVDNIQAWLPQWRQLGLALADIHGWLGNALMWFAALRATAALYHHFWQRTPF